MLEDKIFIEQNALDKLKTIARLMENCEVRAIALSKHNIRKRKEIVIDDFYIHLQYARNIALGHGFSFNAGDPVFGDTSPTWAFLLAGSFFLTNIPLYIIAQVCTMIFSFGSVIVFYFFLEKLTKQRGFAFGGALLFLLDHWFRKTAIGMGMEVSLTVFVVLLFFYCLFFLKEHRWGLPVLAGLINIAPLIRPEFGLLYSLLILALIVDK